MQGCITFVYQAPVAINNNLVNGPTNRRGKFQENSSTTSALWANQVSQWFGQFLHGTLCRCCFSSWWLWQQQSLQEQQQQLEQQTGATAAAALLQVSILALCWNIMLCQMAVFPSCRDRIAKMCCQQNFVLMSKAELPCLLDIYILRMYI